MQEDSEGGPRNQTQQQFFLFNLLLYLQICFVCQLFVGDKDNISPWRNSPHFRWDFTIIGSVDLKKLQNYWLSRSIHSQPTASSDNLEKKKNTTTKRKVKAETGKMPAFCHGSKSTKQTVAPIEDSERAHCCPLNIHISPYRRKRESDTRTQNRIQPISSLSWILPLSRSPNPDAIAWRWRWMTERERVTVCWRPLM